MRDFPLRRVAALLGREPLRWLERSGGYTDAGRWTVEFAEGPSVFVKAAGGAGGDAVRREAAVLDMLSGSFHPKLLALDDDDGYVIEVVEDLSNARWPPPYPDDVHGLFAALSELAEHAAPAGLRRLKAPSTTRWDALARDREWIAELEVCSNAWLDSAVDALAAAEQEFDPSGDRLVHNDLWSGNLAFLGDRCVFVDWAEAHLGAPSVDMGFAMLSLRSEGARSTTPRFDGDLSFASWWSADLAARLTRGVESWLDPSIEAGLRQDLQFALVWAAELLELSHPLGGRRR